MPSVQQAAENNEAYAARIGTICDANLLMVSPGMAPRESILVYARYFEANASADGNTQATCQALADAGYMTPDANGSFKRRLDFPTSVVSVYQVCSSILTMAEASQ